MKKKPSKHVRRLAALLLLCLACAAARGQQARKLAATENTRCDFSEVWPLNDLASEVMEEIAKRPAEKVAVVVYGRPGDSMAYARDVRRWLSEVRGVAPGRLLEIFGGPAYAKRLELWLVPPGAAPPPSAPPAAEGQVTLFDKYTYFPGEYCGPDRPPTLELFAETLKSLPGWRGTIVVRPHVNRPGARGGDEHFDPLPLTRRQAARRAAEDRLHLVRRLGLDPARVRAVVGAPDRWAHAELWLVPPAAQAPGGR